MTRLWPTVFVGLTAFITTVMIEACYFIFHLLRSAFDLSAMSFDWIEPLPVAGLCTTAVLLVGFFVGRVISLSSEQTLDDCAVEQPTVFGGQQTNLKSA